jgi:hypothetical protein
VRATAAPAGRSGRRTSSSGLVAVLGLPQSYPGHGQVVENGARHPGPRLLAAVELGLSNRKLEGAPSSTTADPAAQLDQALAADRGREQPDATSAATSSSTTGGATEAKAVKSTGKKGSGSHSGWPFFPVLLTAWDTATAAPYW